MPGTHRPKDQGAEVKKLKNRLAAAEETLAAIRGGQVDAVLVSGPAGDRVLTLSGAENGYRVFVEAMSEGAVTVAPDGTIFYCNRGFATILDRPLDHLIGSSFRDLVAPAHGDVFNAMLNSEAVERSEVSLLDREGREVPVYLSVTRFEEHGNQAFCIVVTDLRAQKRQEEVVAAAKLSRLLVDQALEAIAVCDATGRIVLASRSLHKLCGCNPLFERFEDMLRLELTEGQNRALVSAEIFSGQKYRAIEVLAHPVKGGDSCHMLLSAGPMTLPDQTAKGYVIALYDVEERRRAQEALRRSEKLAATGRLAATIAHEINNPLEAITNLLFLCAATNGVPDSVKEYVRIAQAELSRVSHITRQTLAFHRQSPHAEPVRVMELIDSVLFLYGRRAMEKQIEITREVDYTGTIIGYAGELRQVISNLVANAIEACPGGGRLRLRAHESREYNNSHKRGVRIVIADTGSGIPRESVERIFEPFYTTKGEKGSGLGLWVSQGIISKHGGQIRMRSNNSSTHTGTVFSIFLPFSSEEVEQAQVTRAS